MSAHKNSIVLFLVLLLFSSLAAAAETPRPPVPKGVVQDGALVTKGGAGPKEEGSQKDQKPAIHVKVHHIFFDKAPGGLAVKEAMIVNNTGKEAFTGDREVKPGKKETLRVSLPKGAVDFRFLPPLETVVNEPGSFSVTTPLKPGITEIVFGYAIPSGDLYTFSKTLSLKTDILAAAFSDPNLKIKSEHLAFKELPPDSRQPFRQLIGKNFTQGSRITLELAFTPQSDFSKWITGALIIPVLVGGIAFAYARRKNEKT